MRRNTLALLLSLVLVIVSSPRNHAAQPAPVDLSKVEELVEKNDTAGAVKLLEGMVKADPSARAAWVRMGQLLHTQGKYVEAAAAFEKALALRTDFRALFNAACAYSRAGKLDLAFERLDKAVATGGVTPALLEKDQDLAPVRQDPRFAALRAAAERAAEPCKFQKESSLFDFWVGEWLVHPNGLTQKAGDSRIEKILGGCVLLENWTGGTGWSGKSFNIYDQARKSWHQTWVDQSGGITHFVDGEYKDGAMRFRTEPRPNAKGVVEERRLTFTNLGPDRVRQHSRMSSDGGKTWQDEYDFIYERVK